MKNRTFKNSASDWPGLDLSGRRSECNVDCTAGKWDRLLVGGGIIHFFMEAYTFVTAL